MSFHWKFEMKNSFKLLTRCIAFVGFTVSSFSFLNTQVYAADLVGDYKPGNPIYDRWDHFYKIEQTDSKQAEEILNELSQLTPQDIKVWKSLTYLQIREQKPEQALFSVTRATQLAPEDEQLQLQQAYLLNQLQRNDEALPIFKKLTHSKQTDIAEKANQAVNNLSGGTAVKSTFKDIYFAPSYESRFDDGIFPLKIRYGKNYDQGRAQLYGFLSFNRDTQSTGLNNSNSAETKIFDENAVVAGFGVNYQPWQTVPMRFYAEVGGSYDLIDRPENNNPQKTRSKFRESITAGAAAYQEWYANPNIEQRHIFNDYFTDFYGNVATYSREDYNVIADLRLRSGFNLYRGEVGTVQAYAKLHTLADSEGESYNNLFEVGPGIAWQPFNYLPVKLRLERLYGYYLKDDNNGQDHYNNTRVEMVLYKDF